MLVGVMVMESAVELVFHIKLLALSTVSVVLSPRHIVAIPAMDIVSGLTTTDTCAVSLHPFDISV